MPKVAKSILAVTARLLLACVLALLCYATYWGIRYRIPCGPPKLINVRKNLSQPVHYVIFCASLADNPHGFPGHCYIVWSDNPNPDLMRAESAAYMPSNYWDQIRSLWMPVPAILYRKAAAGNMRNLDQVIAEVDEDEFERSKAVRDHWEVSWFQVGYRDCVCLTNKIARSVGLETPDPFFQFPQDYIRELKGLNQAAPGS